MAEAQLTNQLTRIDSMTNVELRAELKRRGCPTSGNKKDLLAKLRAALQKEYEQTALEAASTTSTMDSMSMDGRNNNLSNLQQSPVVSYDVNRSSLNNSSNNYMTPHGGSPIVYSQHMHPGEVPLTYANLQMHDQSAAPYPPVYNLTMHQNIHQPPAPMIPVPQQLNISPSERHHMYDPSLLHNQQQQQYLPMNARQQRISVDHPMNPQISPPIPVPVAAPIQTPEKKTRARSKKPSVDSPPIAMQQLQPPPYQQPQLLQQPPQQQQQQISPNINPPPVNRPQQIVTPTSIPQTIHDEQFVTHPPPSINNGNNLEMNQFVSTSIEEEHKDIDRLRPDRGDSRSPSVGSSSTKSESVIKEIPLSGDRHRLSRSKSPKSRWHHSPSPQEQQQSNQSTTIEGTSNSALSSTNNNHTLTNEQIDKSSTVTLFAEETGDLAADEKKQDTIKKQGSALVEPEKPASQQQLKPSRSQTTPPASSSLMKGLNRSTTSNRVNLSSDVLKTLIPDISLAPESLVNDEFETTTNEQGNGDDIDLSANQPMLETSVGSGFLLSDSMTIGDLADQKQQRNRTVVIDVAVDSSSLNDDFVGNNLDNRKKTQTHAPPTRVASYESKALIDGKTNALMVDEPVRIKDATTALEPPSQIVYIRGLTRPFTLPLLKELLSRYGTLVDGEFWLDKIKSQCFIMYNTVEEAQNAREGLDGCRWPSTNPKTLTVRFGRQDEFEFSKTHDLPPDQMPNDTMDTSNNRVVQEKPSFTNKISTSASPDDESKLNNNKKLRPTGNTDIREWDLPKFQQEKEKPSAEWQSAEEPTAKTNEPPPKCLDDYFRKTKAKPAIYWLPLTDEQIVERTRRQEQRNAERDEEQRKRQTDENARSSNSNKDSKSRSNNNENSSSKTSHRRSPSPREKRRRVSPSQSSPKRDNKRH